MNLLLLLSALLSALTGGQIGVRTPRATVAVSQATRAAVAPRAMRAVRADRPLPPPPSLTTLRRAPTHVAWRLLPVEPAFVRRRRE